MDIRVYTDALDLIEKEIKKITMKGEMSPTELVNLKEAVTAACKIVEMVGELPSESADGMGTSYAVTPRFMHRYSGRPYGEHERSVVDNAIRMIEQYK